MWETQWKLHCYPHDCSVRQKITHCKILSQKNEGQGPFGNILWVERWEVRTSINLRCEPEKIDMMFICPPSRSARVCWVMALFTNPFSAWSIRSRHAWVCIMISRILDHDLGTGDAARGRGTVRFMAYIWECSWWIHTRTFWCWLQCSLWNKYDGYCYNMNPSQRRANCIYDQPRIDLPIGNHVMNTYFGQSKWVMLHSDHSSDPVGLRLKSNQKWWSLIAHHVSTFPSSTK